MRSIRMRFSRAAQKRSEGRAGADPEMFRCVQVLLGEILKIEIEAEEYIRPCEIVGGWDLFEISSREPNLLLDALRVAERLEMFVHWRADEPSRLTVSVKLCWKGPTKSGCFLQFVARCHNNGVIGIHDVRPERSGS